MSIVLKNRVHAAVQSTDALGEKLLNDHRGAMFCYDVQDLIQSVVSLLQDLNAGVERWQDQSASHDPDAQIAMQDFLVLYQSLANVCAGSAKLVQCVEKDGHQVVGKNEFLNAWKELRGIVCFSVSSVESSIQEIRTGKSHLLGDVKNGLWDDPVRQGQA